MQNKNRFWRTVALISAGLTTYSLWRTVKKRRLRPVLGQLATSINQTETIHPFVVTLKNQTLTIYHVDNPHKVLFASQPNKSFVQAAKATADVFESRGLFTITDNVLTRCGDQSIDRMTGNGETVTLSGRLSGDGAAVGYTMSFKSVGKQRLSFQISLEDASYERTYLTVKSYKNTRYFGFGEQYSYFNMKGRLLPIIVSEQGIGRGEQPITLGADLTAGAGGTWHHSYAGVPHYMTSSLQSLFLSTSEYAVFDMRADDFTQIKLHSHHMTGEILYGESPADLIDAYTDYAGKMRVLPEWVTSGAILGVQGGTDKVRTILNKFKAADVPVAGLWLQDWVGQRTTTFGKQLWWNWELDTDHYHHWRELVADLEADGIRPMIYLNPFLADVDEKANARRNLFREAQAKGYLAKDEAGRPFMILNTSFSAGLVDLTNPDAVAWFKQLMRDEALPTKAFGWMADFGEGLPFEAVLASGESAESYHNTYAEDWAKLNRELIEELPNGDEYVFFSRSGYTRSPAYSTLFWLGDQLVSWDANDGLKTAVLGLLSSGLSGYAFNHSDIGGYTTITNPLKNYHRSKELQMRWSEMAAFNVIYRSHEGNIPEVNHQAYSDAETLAHFGRMAKVYKAWEFYRRALVRESAETGLPVVRSLFIHYPNDENVYDIVTQFLVGSELLVAPVLDPNTSQVTLYLPQGDWVDLWRSRTYSGGRTITVNAPIGQPPVFFKANSNVGAQFVSNLENDGIL